MKIKLDYQSASIRVALAFPTNDCAAINGIYIELVLLNIDISSSEPVRSTDPIRQKISR